MLPASSAALDKSLIFSAHHSFLFDSEVAHIVSAAVEKSQNLEPRIVDEKLVSITYEIWELRKSWGKKIIVFLLISKMEMIKNISYLTELL